MINQQNEHDPLWGKFNSRLQEVENDISGASAKNYIPFPFIFQKICRCFSIQKNEAWKCLFYLQKKGQIKIIKFKGVRLNFKVKLEAIKK